MKKLDQYVTEKNATAFVSTAQPVRVTSAERAGKSIREAIGELDRLRFHTKNTSVGGPWERITKLMQDLGDMSEELDRAMNRAEELAASTAAK